MTNEVDDPWEKHSLMQRQAWLALSYRERLNWLWQAKMFAAKAINCAKNPAVVSEQLSKNSVSKFE